MRTDELKEYLPAMATPGKPLSMVIVYEDFPARLRMQKVLWMLTRKFSRQHDFTCSWYGFDDLKNFRLAAKAHVAATAADLVLFSVNVETEPPETVKAWVESWIELKGTQDAALAALLNKKRSVPHKTSSWKYLNQIAQRAGMSFLPEIIRTEQLCGTTMIY